MYSFTLKYGLTSVACYPRGEEKFEKEYFMEDEELYKRIKLNGELIFVDSDYNNIIAQPYGTKFTIVIKRDAIESNYYTGKFYLKDCEVNKDRKTITVSLSTDDNYDKVNAIKGNEIAINSLPIKTRDISYKIPPLFQIYEIGDNRITNYQGGLVWEQDCMAIDFDSEFRTELEHRCNIFGTAYQKSNYLIGGIWHATEFDNYYNPTKYTHSGGIEAITIYTNNGASRRWQINIGAIIAWVSDTRDATYTSRIEQFTFVNQSGVAQNQQFFESHVIISRLLVNASMLSGGKYKGYTVVSNEFNLVKNEAYPYVVTDEYQLPNAFDLYVSDACQLEQTEYNINHDGKYFIKPEPFLGFDYYPIGKTLWGYTSIWIHANETLNSLQYDNSKNSFINYGYHLFDIIEAIFKKYNINLSVVSEFFQNGTNPISGIGRLEPMFSLISSFIGVDSRFNTQGEFKMSLSTIFDFLRSMNLYWSIDREYFKIEHKFYYENGERYAQFPSYNVLDFTQKFDVRNELSICDLLDNWKYDPKNEYKEIELNMMKSNSYFEKSLIKIDIDTNETKTITQTSFCSDMNYLLTLNAGENVGFFFGMCSDDLGILSLPYGKVANLKQTQVCIQNFYASLPYIAQQMHQFDYPTEYIEIDGVSLEASGFYRIKVQEVEYVLPESNVDINQYNLIKTNLGNGFIENIVVNLKTRLCKIKLRHLI